MGNNHEWGSLRLNGQFALMTMQGSLTRDHALEMIKQLSAAKGLSRIFIDVREVQAYETSFREHWIVFLKANNGVRVDILVHSALQKMGISLANMVLTNKVTGHTDPRLFNSLKEESLQTKTSP